MSSLSPAVVAAVGPTKKGGILAEGRLLENKKGKKREDEPKSHFP